MFFVESYSCVWMLDRIRLSWFPDSDLMFRLLNHDSLSQLSIHFSFSCLQKTPFPSSYCEILIAMVCLLIPFFVLVVESCSECWIMFSSSSWRLSCVQFPSPIVESCSRIPFAESILAVGSIPLLGFSSWVLIVDAWSYVMIVESWFPVESYSHVLLALHHVLLSLSSPKVLMNQLTAGTCSHVLVVQVCSEVLPTPCTDCLFWFVRSILVYLLIRILLSKLWHVSRVPVRANRVWHYNLVFPRSRYSILLFTSVDHITPCSDCWLLFSYFDCCPLSSCSDRMF